MCMNTVSAQLFRNHFRQTALSHSGSHESGRAWRSRRAQQSGAVGGERAQSP